MDQRIDLVILLDKRNLDQWLEFNHTSLENVQAKLQSMLPPSQSVSQYCWAEDHSKHYSKHFGDHHQEDELTAVVTTTTTTLVCSMEGNHASDELVTQQSEGLAGGHKVQAVLSFPTNHYQNMADHVTEVMVPCPRGSPFCCQNQDHPPKATVKQTMTSGLPSLHVIVGAW